MFSVHTMDRIDRIDWIYFAYIPLYFVYAIPVHKKRPTGRVALNLRTCPVRFGPKTAMARRRLIGWLMWQGISKIDTYQFRGKMGSYLGHVFVAKTCRKSLGCVGFIRKGKIWNENHDNTWSVEANYQQVLLRPSFQTKNDGICDLCPSAVLNFHSSFPIRPTKAEQENWGDVTWSHLVSSLGLIGPTWSHLVLLGLTWS